jgi:hypothetical protein
LVFALFCFVFVFLFFAFVFCFVFIHFSLSNFHFWRHCFFQHYKEKKGTKGVNRSRKSKDMPYNVKRPFLFSWFISGNKSRVTRQVPLVEQVLPTLPEHLMSLRVVSGVLIVHSSIFYLCFIDLCLSFCR